MGETPEALGIPDLLEHILRCADEDTVRIARTVCRRWYHAATRVLEARAGPGGDPRYSITTKCAAHSPRMLRFSGMLERLGADQVFAHACRSLQTAKWVADKYSITPAQAHARGKMALQTACASGRLDVVKWLVARFGKGDMRYAGDDGFQEACGNGHREVAEWVLTNVGLTLRYLDSDTIHCSSLRTFDLACGHGHLDIAQWLHDMCAFSVDDIVQGNIFTCVCAGGHIKVARWLMDTFAEPQREVFRGEYPNAFAMACRSGHLHLVQWFAPHVTREEVCGDNMSAMQYACLNGHLRVVKWVVQHFGLMVVEDSPDLFGTPFVEACSGGRLMVAQWLNDQLALSHGEGATAAPIPKHYIYLSLAEACSMGHLDVVKWLVSCFGLTLVDVEENLHEGALGSTCLDGPLHVAEWLVEYFGYTCDDVTAKNLGLLKKMCRSGKLDSVKWVVDRFDIQPESGTSAVVEILYGSPHARPNLEIIKWLYCRFKLAPSQMRLENNCLLAEACGRGLPSLDMVRWLLEDVGLTEVDLRESEGAKVAAQRRDRPITDYLTTRYGEEFIKGACM